VGFSLENFENACYKRQHETAGRELANLLQDLDSHLGDWGAGFEGRAVNGLASQEAVPHVLARIGSAMSCLFSDPAFQFSADWHKRTFELHRWISALLASGPFHNADHVLRSLNLASDTPGAPLQVSNENLHKFCVLYTQESEIALDLDALWQSAPVLTASLCLSLMSPRFLGTVAAHAKREVLLQWLPPKLLEIENIEALPLGIVHDVYMHCSYADAPNKHDIKKSINTLIRRFLLQQGLADRVEKDSRQEFGQDVAQGQGLVDGKPVVLVVLEWFTSNHSVYRTHSRSLAALKERFHVVGMGFESMVDDNSRAVFDRFIPIDRQASMLDQVRSVMAQAQQLQPAVYYSPAVGMFPLTIFLSNLRFAPIQVVALGHGASTMAHCMDYYVLDEDFIGDPACFSETLIRMPVDSMPFVRSSAQEELTPELRIEPSPVRIAVASSLMKFNPRFLQACRAIQNQSSVPVEFHFLPGMAIGLGHIQLKTLVARYMPTAIVHPHLAYPEYMKQLNQCDMYLNPFPYGNMNGIADMSFQGLVGVCRTGPEVHEHIDQGIFERLGLPQWLVAKTDEEYVQAALRLAQNHHERVALGRGLLERQAVEVLYQGRPGVLADKLWDLVQANQSGQGLTEA
jgi:HMW1 domain 2/HMW1C N-terminal